MTPSSDGDSRGWRLGPEKHPGTVDDIRHALVSRKGGLFLLTDVDGSIPVDNTGGFGLYHDDTRYLSGWDLSIHGVHPVVLLSTAALGFGQDQVMTNPELTNGEGEIVHRGALEIHRQRVLNEEFIERVQLTNYLPVPLTLTLQYEIEADFVDIFELRGTLQQKRGRLFRPSLADDSVRFAYEGLDDIMRELSIQFQRRPTRLAADTAQFDLSVAPGRKETIETTIGVNRAPGAKPKSFAKTLPALIRVHDAWKESSTQVQTSNDLFNAALDRSIADLRLLWNEPRSGIGYLAAGVPWYDTLFGRDSILSAMMSLWIKPEIGRDVLRSLERFQGNDVNPARDEEPGKIVHEIRRGEMANTGEVAFGRYYGSVDATPLFVLLASEYYRWTVRLTGWSNSVT
jgi:glycogen debranching enzyme